MPPHRHHRLGRALLAWSLLSLATVVVASQAPQKPENPPQQERPTFRTEANFVRVDAYPTKAGAPVMDLRQDEFEVLEDGVAQSIQTFEHVVVRGGGPLDQRAEPNTVRESNQLAANPRNRVFVLFLDPSFVSVESSWAIREPLVRMLDRLLGPEDLIGVMTPMMTANDLTLARKTSVIEGGLRDRWPWGQRSTLDRDEREQMYNRCYPPLTQELKAGMSESALAREMIARRRERRSLDAMRELVLHLRDIREERKAIITVSEGWVLFRRNPGLLQLRQDEAMGSEAPPGPPPISVGPGGKLTTRDPRTGSGDEYECNADRMRLSDIDDDQYLRDIIGEANRGNSSFYTVDPRGLAVFDAPIGPEPPPPPGVDMNTLRNRQNAMRTLAEATDGLAVMNNNDLDKSLRQITEDLSSYYLLGYYSTNAKLDGRYRTLKVRVKRPGVDVRARRGYRAATTEEVAAARNAAAAPVSEATSSVAAAMGSLDRVRPGTRFYLHAIRGPSDESGVTRLWVAGEFQPTSGPDPWAAGGTADIDVSAGGGSGTAHVIIPTGSRAFVAPVTLAAPVTAGSAEVKVRLAGTDATAERTNQSVRVNIEAPPQALLFRRGPTTGNRLQAVATFQFSRTERLHLELPVSADAPKATARLVGKTGQEIAVPVTVSERLDDGGGQRWITADLTLAPLAMGDYAIELTLAAPGQEQRVLTPFRLAR